TLTEGEFGVTNIIPRQGYEEQNVLNWAASLEQHSEHPIATGIVKSAKDKGMSLKEIADFESITGKGIQGSIDGKKVNVVSPGYVNDNNLSYDQDHFQQMSGEGKTVVFFLIDDELVDMIALADIVRETAKEAIAKLKKEGVHYIMLTGDNTKVANWVAKQLDIDDIYAEVLPNEKSDKVNMNL